MYGEAEEESLKFTKISSFSCENYSSKLKQNLPFGSIWQGICQLRGYLMFFIHFHHDNVMEDDDHGQIDHGWSLLNDSICSSNHHDQKLSFTYVRTPETTMFPALSTVVPWRFWEAEVVQFSGAIPARWVESNPPSRGSSYWYMIRPSSGKSQPLRFYFGWIWKWDHPPIYGSMELRSR